MRSCNRFLNRRLSRNRTFDFNTTSYSPPLVSAAMERGEVSYSNVRAITRVATPENEHYFLQIALHGTAHHVETLVRAYRRARKRKSSRASSNSRRIAKCVISGTTTARLS